MERWQGRERGENVEESERREVQRKSSQREMTERDRSIEMSIKQQQKEKRKYFIANRSLHSSLRI